MSRLIKTILYILLIVGVLIGAKWWFETIYYSDLPTWFKYLLLR